MRDIFIAGIAIAQGAAVATRNTRHFENTPIPIINPWGKAVPAD
jgi:predicted nucleic acid-binding protein